MSEKRFICKDCKYHSDVKGEVIHGLPGYPPKIIHPSKFGHCLLYEWNLSNWDICKHFKVIE